jgi:cell division septation protein DedD
MQSLTGPVQIDMPHRGYMTMLCRNRVTAALVVALLLLASLGACSLVDTKSDAGDGQMDARDSAADQQGLEAIVARLADDQQEYEARLLALEAIVLRGYPLAPAAGHPATPSSATSTVAAQQLASLPIEPDVILQPPLEPVAAPVMQAGTGVSGMAPPAEEKSPVSTPVETSPPPAARSGGWVINLGSYSNKQVADRMLAGFRQQDIDAEQVRAVVNDRTLYRVRITGFDTRQAAIRHAESLQGTLDIGDVWIMRN